MFEFVMPESYALVYYIVCFLISLNTLFLYHHKSKLSNTLIYINGYFLLFFIVFYIGLRPLYAVFGDMINYYKIFTYIEYFSFDDISKDPVFYFLIYLMRAFLSVDLIFLLISLFYIFPIYYISKRIDRRYWLMIFLVMITPFSFWAYGVNGIRNGLATSVFMLALFSNSRYMRFFLIGLSVGLHISLIIPVVGYLAYKFKPNVRYFIWFWFASIPLSLLGSTYFGLFLESAGFQDQRLIYLMDTDSSDKFSSVGFRVDFFIYSLTGVIPAIYCYMRSKVDWVGFDSLISVYLFSNAVWIIFIDASFSNRFAYLSWFLLGVIYSYYIISCFSNSRLKYYMFLAILFNISMSIFMV